MYRLRGWWLRRSVRFWLALERTSERRLRAAYDRLAEHDTHTN
jgi:hypothetical protein